MVDDKNNMPLVRPIRGEKLGFLIGHALIFFRKVVVICNIYKGWGIVYLIINSTNKMIRLGVRAYT